MCSGGLSSQTLMSGKNSRALRAAYCMARGERSQRWNVTDGSVSKCLRKERVAIPLPQPQSMTSPAPVGGDQPRRFSSLRT